MISFQRCTFTIKRKVIKCSPYPVRLGQKVRELKCNGVDLAETLGKKLTVYKIRYILE